MSTTGMINNDHNNNGGLGSTVVTSPANEARGLWFESRWRQIISVRGSDGICKYLPYFSSYLMIANQRYVYSYSEARRCGVLPGEVATERLDSRLQSLWRGSTYLRGLFMYLFIYKSIHIKEHSLQNNTV